MDQASGRLSEFLKGVEKFLYGGTTKETGIKQFAERLPIWLNAIGAQADPIAEALPAFGDTLRYINTTATAIMRIFGPEGTAIADVAALQEGGIERISTGITGLVEKISDFRTALEGVKGINLNTELQALSDRLGLRSAGRITVRQQPVTLNVNFNITIDSEELEKALVERTGTRIQTTDR
jgi:hypothetical protein